MNARSITLERFPRKRLSTALIMAAMMAACLFALAPPASASTAANTTITNSVTVTFDNAAGVAQTAVNATATVIVDLVAAAPTLSSPASIDPATENTAYVLSYTITGNANGEDDYTLSTANGPNNINPASLIVNGGVAGSGDPVLGSNITLGGTTLAAAASIGAGQITVPYDSNADGDASSTNGITDGDTIMVGGNPYVVAVGGISENAGANLTTINLVGTIAGTPGSIGDVVGERATFTVDATTSTVIAGGSGFYTLSTTAASATVPGETTTQATNTLITVWRPLLSVAKYVQNVDSPVAGGGSSIGPLDVGGGAGSQTYYSQGVTGVPGETLEYVIVISNPGGSGMASDVIIEDQIPPFTAYVAGSMLLDDGSGVFNSVTDVETDLDAGEYDGTPGSETVWIYAGSGGADSGAATTYGDGTGGTMNAGIDSRGVFRVIIQ